MKLKINGETYSELYKFNGGTYFIPDSETSFAWVALMDNGTLKLLINGKHIDYSANYEIISVTEGGTQ